ncbi:hypothetical protein [Methylobacterium sp. J-076]|uniref:hypothetical protein n=1 Tax=Methylobacterium sp. J-076 TaxID=2836655 RepID=UPI001FB9F158|nr:hypothetical protein [Methylobacterium sp. J-076]MCJ2014016.1 hypothetical protein [Methylobacterium sp. J-076]
MRTLVTAACLVLVAGAAGAQQPAGTAGACGALAARYENGKGFTLSVIRAGEVRIVNPLRPLTPEVTQVLEVVIGDKRATAYGPDFTSLRRGGPPGAIQASLGAPITWEAALPPLPDSLGIVADDGAPLAELTFRTCETRPAVAPEPVPQAARKGGKARGAAATGDGTAPAAKARPKPAAKTPGGFSMPQGAIGE